MTEKNNTAREILAHAAEASTKNNATKKVIFQKNKKDVTSSEAVAILQVMRADIARMSRDTLNESRIKALNKAIKLLKVEDEKERAIYHENTEGTTV